MCLQHAANLVGGALDREIWCRENGGGSRRMEMCGAARAIPVVRRIVATSRLALAMGRNGRRPATARAQDLRVAKSSSSGRKALATTPQRARFLLPPALEKLSSGHAVWWRRSCAGWWGPLQRAPPGLSRAKRKEENGRVLGREATRSCDGSCSHENLKLVELVRVRCVRFFHVRCVRFFHVRCVRFLFHVSDAWIIALPI
jgi:hypothetical protein